MVAVGRCVGRALSEASLLVLIGLFERGLHLRVTRHAVLVSVQGANYLAQMKSVGNSALVLALSRPVLFPN
jgi:hypothetical protein